MITEIGSRLKITDPSPELVAWCKKNLEMQCKPPLKDREIQTITESVTRYRR